MPYRPSFETSSFGTARLLGAVFPAGISAALCGMIFAGVIGLVAAGGDRTLGAAISPFELLAALILIPVSFGLALILATFVCCFYIVIFGLPVAWILGDRIRHKLSWLVIAPITLLSTLQAYSWFWGANMDTQTNDAWVPDLGVLSIAMGFALPAAHFYRHFLIAFRDEDELLD